jgi:AcrR family transcriptional regulator
MASQLGLAQVTLGTLAGRARLSKSGLFTHFGSKDALTAAVLEAAAALGEEEILRPAMAEPEGLPRLIVFMRRWLRWAHLCGFPGGCPCVAAIFELDDVESAVRSVLLDVEAQWHMVLAGMAGLAVFVGHLRPDLDAGQDSRLE